jgi:hypothetical protein
MFKAAPISAGLLVLGLLLLVLRGYEFIGDDVTLPGVAISVLGVCRFAVIASSTADQSAGNPAGNASVYDSYGS